MITARPEESQSDLVELDCDYLIIGAGAASLAFLDTLLTELPNARIVLVDKHDAPGGHWNDAYDFVRLHQPSMFYGLASRQLEGNWLWLLLTKFTKPWEHRASKQEILSYYASAVQTWVDQGKVKYYPNCVFDFAHAKKHPSGPQRFKSLDGTEEYSVTVRRKVVDGTEGEPLIPSTHPIPFPVDKGIEVLKPNDLPKLKRKHSHYLVCGCGKTGMDTCVYLQEEMGVDPKDITWVVSQEPYMINRGKLTCPFSRTQKFLEASGDRAAALQRMEKKGELLTLFEKKAGSAPPTVFRFPIISQQELTVLRRITRVICRGRVARIEKESDGISLHFKDGGEAATIQGDVSVVHCCAPGPFNGKGNEGGPGKIFISPHLLRLGLLLGPPIGSSMSMIAMLEACSSKDLLDKEAARKLLGTDDESLTGEELLSQLITPFPIAKIEDPLAQLHPITILAVYFGICKQVSVSSLCSLLCDFGLADFFSSQGSLGNSELDEAQSIVLPLSTQIQVGPCQAAEIDAGEEGRLGHVGRAGQSADAPNQQAGTVSRPSLDLLLSSRF